METLIQGTQTGIPRGIHLTKGWKPPNREYERSIPGRKASTRYQINKFTENSNQGTKAADPRDKTPTENMDQQGDTNGTSLKENAY